MSDDPDPDPLALALRARGMTAAEDALVEAMALGIKRAGLNASRRVKARAALAALRQRRPDLAAVMDGEAVAVPANGPTADMAIAWGAPAGFFGGWRAMLAASPYAPPRAGGGE